ncbi:class I SAM-dependent DNA methyltransferase [Virgisporangium aurantiacum]|uniref:SAM-dependent methyltransferase n=1 Tax=Virgisporangium aurantiacum TaxID=175570 RepID=A0A8J4DZQ2_9ACTN|nr:class I SAM-dependent methyltransferase [Virgisporangium aurantiacum]GIJ56980.1 SAM-dependent methyltransferase [Virgisporangium aurantiacum]
MTEYDQFADEYDQTFQLAPWRTHIEAYSLLKRVGDVRDRAWLDVACGTGPYARALRQRGARQVVGVDLSAEMLRVARLAEERTPLGIEYHQHDVATMPRLGEFDGAIGSHLLHYAPDAARLRGMCDSVADNLVPGGRFVTFQLNPDLARRPDYYLPYGAEISLDSSRTLTDGDALTFRINVPGFRSPEVTVYHWTRARLDETLGAAGFERIRWSAPELSPEAAQGPDPQQWRDFLDRPLCMVIECVRSTAT